MEEPSPDAAATAKPQELVTVRVENPISGELIASFPKVPSTRRLEHLQRQLPRSDLQSMYKFTTEAVILHDLLAEVREGELKLLACRVPTPLLLDRATSSVALLAESCDPDDGIVTIANRDANKNGGMAITQALPWKDGVASFEVIIMEMEERGHEGLEMGITSCALADGFSLHETYAVLSSPSWVSSDAGALWISGSKQYGSDFRPWKHTLPKRLQAGDVVRLVFYNATGDLEMFVNGKQQARWIGDSMRNKLKVTEGQPLFGLIGLRRPLKVARVRLPDPPIA